MFLTDVRAFGDQFRDAFREGVGREVLVPESVLNRVGEIRFADVAVIEFVCVALDEVSRGRRQSDMDGVEVSQCRLPRRRWNGVIHR